MKDLFGDEPLQFKQAEMFDDGSLGKRERDLGIARVTESNEQWMAEGIALIRRLHGFEGIFEDVKHLLRQSGFREPTIYNGWGALARHAIGLKLLLPTGEWRRPKDVASHARPTRVYRRG